VFKKKSSIAKKHISKEVLKQLKSKWKKL
jgi:hypothetical protein